MYILYIHTSFSVISFRVLSQVNHIPRKRNWISIENNNNSMLLLCFIMLLSIEALVLCSSDTTRTTNRQPSVYTIDVSIDFNTSKWIATIAWSRLGCRLGTQINAYTKYSCYWPYTDQHCIFLFIIIIGYILQTHMREYNHLIDLPTVIFNQSRLFIHFHGKWFFCTTEFDFDTIVWKKKSKGRKRFHDWDIYVMYVSFFYVSICAISWESYYLNCSDMACTIELWRKMNVVR